MEIPRPRPAVLSFLSAVVVASGVALAACGSAPSAAPQAGRAEPEGAASAPAPMAAALDGRALDASADAATMDGGSEFQPRRVAGEGHAMGTHLAFTAYTTETVDEAQTRRLFDLAIAEIERLERLMTTWRPDSEVSRINAEAGKAPVAVSRETFDVIRESLRASELSDGAFDISFEALHGLWKFDEDLDPNPPPDAAIKKLLPLVNYKNVVLDEARSSVFLKKTGMRVSLGGIAKGYAVDRAAKVLRDGGLTSFFVQAGGDLYTSGKKPDGSDWLAGIRDPRGTKFAYFAMLPVSDHAFSTAGDYERSYVRNGRRYHHIIDPHTGHPATACRSVTIWAPTAFLADAIDDAVFILGPQRGLKIVEALDDVGAVIVDAKNNLWISKRLQGRIQLTAVPTDGL